MSAREAVLGALRSALGRSRPDPAAVAAEARALLADPDAVRPALPVADPVEAFAARVVSPKVGATLDRVGTLANLPGAVRRYLDGHGLPPLLALQPDPALQDLDWTGFTLRGAALPDEAAAFGMARWGVAETGSLVFHSGPDTAVLDVMQRDIPVVGASQPLEEAVRLMQDGGLPAVGVVDADGRLMGLVTPENLGELMMVQSLRPKAPPPPANPWASPERPR